MKTNGVRLLVVAATLLTATAGLTACGGGGGSGSMDMGMGMGHEHMHQGAPAAPDPVADGARTIRVVATSFSFAPSEIRIDAGEEVAIELTSEDVTHDFVVDGPPGHVVAAAAGETATGGLRIDDPGDYPVYCSVSGHRSAGMEGVIVVAAA